MQKDKKTQKLILPEGRLASTAGFLLIELISLFYIVPFTAMAKESDIALYAAVKDILVVGIEIGCAGIPLTVYALLKERKEPADDRTVLLIRRIAMRMGIAASAFLTILFLFFAKPMAKWILGTDAAALDLSSLHTLLVIAMIVIFVDPLLADMSGYLLGNDEKKLVVHSKWLEWILRYGLLFLVGSISVLTLHTENGTMPLIGICSIAAACLCADAYLLYHERRLYQIRIARARMQLEPAEDADKIKQAICHLMPVFILSAVFANSDKILHAFFFIPRLVQLGTSYDTAKTLYGLLQWNGGFILNVFLVLSLFFFYPFAKGIMDAWSIRDIDTFNTLLKKWWNKMLSYLLPISFIILCLSHPLSYILFGGSQLEDVSTVVAWSSAVGLSAGIAFIAWLLLILMKRYQEAVVYLLTSAVIKAVSFYLFLQYTGPMGALISTLLSQCIFIFLVFSKIRNLSDVPYGAIAMRACFILVACLAMNGSFVLFRTYVVDLLSLDRGMALLVTAGMVLCGLLVYWFVTGEMGMHGPKGNRKKHAKRTEVMK